MGGALAPTTPVLNSPPKSSDGLRRDDHRHAGGTVTQNQIAALWRLDVALRDRPPLWKMLYESTARADEMLCLNVEDPTPADKCGKISTGPSAAEPGAPLHGCAAPSRHPGR